MVGIQQGPVCWLSSRDSRYAYLLMVIVLALQLQNDP